LRIYVKTSKFLYRSHY